MADQSEVVHEVKPGDDNQPIIKEKTIRLIFTADLDEKYIIKKKKYFNDLPLYDQEGNRITWLSCFGIKKKGSEDFLEQLDEGDVYHIELDNINGDTLVYYFDRYGNLHSLEKHEVNGKYRVSLSDGDPPIGISTG